ncbi:MAG: DNA repair protein RecN [Nitrospirae bacterium CG_4_10_14_3_um_filter_44_29]|nr:MAG: DNA repair protein RecN [Nitrospirae bacterium CG1_02_44_142]PIP71195.1 MAG: DNA repair protein RecN [Nitrospirae bacterium CG22_combo_CG10-13_8_21_14_all_44_11]PIV42829.1 MAG: DNA repair protein RecN [Nitrospirae bacterium CG02_land_8_20_14_3_00_44_33]PIV66167.1 MAG: DNA repair protein RecN [Nitrospirae bacterium CG01_land_8_20_14_3_00_44_22]PIX89272.1 MAG: DNA repair protein RecN [Nitrospirae bacterium CG_4_10_14_3_um_filter_44_29]
MLKELRIKNLAIIDDLRIRFESGLNVLTGETGAGKSIIVDALGLALGERAQAGMIKSGKDEASVEAFFEISEHPLLNEMGIASSEDGIIIRRNISSAGKNRAYINDSIVNIQSLSAIGKTLVDMHGQHEHQSLLSTDNQRTLLDFYGKLHDKRAEVEAMFHEVHSLKKELSELKIDVKERMRRIDILSFQINEIDAASLKKGEKEALEEERGILSNLNKLNELVETAYTMLYASEGACAEKLSSVISKLREMAAIDQSISETLNLLESARPLLEDGAVSLRGFKEKYDLDPRRLETIEERLETIKKLEKKYGDSIDSTIRYRDEAEKELSTLKYSDEKIALFEGQLKEKEGRLMNEASGLSEKRKQTAKEISKAVEKILKELAFEKAGFRVDVRPSPLSSTGIDTIELLFSANPGEPLKPLSKVASGGELSRIMLALKNILADVDKIPVLIFDEIDAGVGGRTAESVGIKLKRLSKTHQVICITHLPQIASAADFHIMTEKYQKEGGTYVKIKELTSDERRAEIARMLSGKITDVSLKHAGELLERSA